MAISPKLLNPGETVLFSARSHPKVLFGPVLVMLLLLAAAVAVQVIADVRGVTLTAWVLAGIGILWFTVRPVVDWFASVHAYTDRRLITRHGVITRRGTDIPLSRVSDVSIEINLIDRLFGCGTLLITNASDGTDIRLHDIPRAEENHRKLNALLHDTNAPERRDEGV